MNTDKKRYDMKIRNLKESECQEIMDLCRQRNIDFTISPREEKVKYKIEHRIEEYEEQVK